MRLLGSFDVTSMVLLNSPGRPAGVISYLDFVFFTRGERSFGVGRTCASARGYCLEDNQGGGTGVVELEFVAYGAVGFADCAEVVDGLDEVDFGRVFFFLPTRR